MHRTTTALSQYAISKKTRTLFYATPSPTTNVHKKHINNNKTSTCHDRLISLSCSTIPHGSIVRAIPRHLTGVLAAEQVDVEEDVLAIVKVELVSFDHDVTYSIGGGTQHHD